MSAVFVYKDTKLHCAKCNDLIAVASREVLMREPRAQKPEWWLYQDQGQAPWYSGERMNCRKCKANFTLRTLIQVVP